ncbi:MAG: histidine phosphatase family protein [Thermaerobacter sp.]|nr:histidine phosphatase family protein [Thermaerobacter sp.]
MKIYVVRHCAATGQAADSPLTPGGEAQADWLADVLAEKGIGAIASSPYLRARSSATPLAQRLGLEVRLDPRLAERVLSQRPLPDWQAALRRTFEDPDLSYAGGETSRAATARGLQALGEVSEGACDAAAVVTHGGLMALILRSFDASFGFDAWATLENPDCYVITQSQGTAAVQRVW